MHGGRRYGPVVPTESAGLKFEAVKNAAGVSLKTHQLIRRQFQEPPLSSRPKLSGGYLQLSVLELRRRPMRAAHENVFRGPLYFHPTP